MTTPTAAAPIQVDSPPPDLPQHGLLSAATQVIDDPVTARWQLTGVAHASVCGGTAEQWLDRCTWPPADADAQAYRIDYASTGDNLTFTLTAKGADYGDQPVTVTTDAQPHTLAAPASTFTIPLTRPSTITVTATIAAGERLDGCTTAPATITVPASGPVTGTITCDALTKVKRLDDPLTFVAGLPYRVYAGATCHLHAARGQDQLTADALLRLALTEEIQVERRFQADELTGAQVTVIAPPATAWSLCQGIGELEQALADAAAGRGVLHVPRRFAPVLASRHLIHRDPAQPGRLLTPLGSRYAFGTGYRNQDPQRVPPAPGRAWLYATGQVVARRTPAVATPVLTPQRNRLEVLAERSYAVTADCPVYAVLVDIPEC